MSFSSDVKQELSNINSLNNQVQCKAELLGYLLSLNSNITKGNIKFSTENEYNINRFNKLLSKFDIKYKIELQGNVYSIKFKKNNLIELDSQILENENNLKALVRGAFLGSGSINNPEKEYHLEILFLIEENLNFIKNILTKFDINLKTIQKKKNYALYIKDSDEISKFLAFIGASKSVLKFEEIRVVRETKNNVNRIVNCETANINKTIKAAVTQKEAIMYLKQINKFNNLPENLKEIAELRVNNPDKSIKELGELLLKPIGKSGVNHRLKKIIQIAEEEKK